MLNDNFYRGSGITVAIQRLIRTDTFAVVEVHLAGCKTIAGRPSTDENLGMVPLDRYHTFSLMNAGFGLPKALFRFCKWVRAMRFDVIHAHHRRLAVLAHMMTPITRVPVLFTGHLTFPETAWFRLLAPRRMTGVSPSVVSYLKRCTRALDVRLVYNPVAFPDGVFQRPASLLRAVSVGRLDPVKGYGVLVEAWARLRQAGIAAILDIYGEGSLQGVLKEQIRSLGLEGIVSLKGFTPDLASHLGDYDFNVLVSQKEGFPNAVVEAATYGLPSLLTDVEGSRDALPPGLELPNGIPYGDAERLTVALMEWFRSPSRVSRDGERFRKSLMARCAPEVVAAQYIAAYESLR